MNFISICSGIECASLAWTPLGWKAVLVAEIEAFPREVLVQRQAAADVRFSSCRSRKGPVLWGDFTSIRRRFLERIGLDLADVDAIVGGTPCQSFSIAGRRLSLSDARGNLALSFIGLANAIDHDYPVFTHSHQR